MCRAIEMSLANHGMGLPEKVSEVDAMVFADDALLVEAYDRKDRRAVRIDRNKNQNERNKRLYDPSNVTNWSKKAAYNEFRGICPVFHDEDEPVAFIKKSRKNGTKQMMDKIENRKIRYERFEEPMPEVEVNVGVALDDEPDYSYAKFDYGFYSFYTKTFDRFDFTGNKSIIFDDRLFGQLANAKAEIYAALQQRKKDLLDKKLALVKEDVELLKKVSENTRREEEIDRQIRELDEQL